MAIEADTISAARMSDGRRLVQFRVRVLYSPAGETRPELSPMVEYIEEELAASLAQLEARTIERDGLLALGRALGLLLLPPPEGEGEIGVRDLFAASLARLGPDEGLRLRLRLAAELAPLPWEYLFVERGGSDGMSGFLALDPRVALVRHEPLPVAAPPPHPGGPLKLVAALASPPGLPKLDLERERVALEQAFAGQAGIEPVVLERATLDALQGALLGAEIFHFAGHGFASGAGALALEDGRVESEQLSVALRGNGVRLALLGACDTGRRNGVSDWAGVAPALVRAEIPAVVANQLTIEDHTAIAFSKHFYGALVGGLPIERAVTAGRIAAYNADPQGRDWGVAVLYLRADGVLFSGSRDRDVRQQAAKNISAVLDIRAAAVQNADIAVIEVGRIKSDRVHFTTTVKADTISNTEISAVEIEEL